MSDQFDKKISDVKNEVTMLKNEVSEMQQMIGNEFELLKQQIHGEIGRVGHRGKGKKQMK